ncbi:hypothetical protein ACUNEH_18430, partial [Serratia sp. IR-2025]
DKAFPEQGAKVSIHSDGSFEGLGCVLANTNLNVLTAAFYWFTLKRDEPKKSHQPAGALGARWVQVDDFGYFACALSMALSEYHL